jgi:hypothetical protein
MGGLTGSTGARTMTTEKILNGNLVTVSGFGQDEVTLYASNAGHVVNYFAHEADRFATACFESLIVGVKKDSMPRSTSWQYIRGYYAAFFALHCLIRLHGWACARILPNSIAGINKQLASLHPGSTAMKGGLYLIKVQSGGRELLCTKLDPGLGGSHEILWSILDSYLDEVTTTLLTNSNTENQQLAAQIVLFQNLVASAGGNTWFTRVRNRINYSHEYGTWYPYVKSTVDYDRANAAFSGWSKTPTVAPAGADELIEFAAACAFLASLCATTIKDLTFRSKSNSPFAQSSGLLVSAV